MAAGESDIAIEVVGVVGPANVAKVRGGRGSEVLMGFPFLGCLSPPPPPSPPHFDVPVPAVVPRQFLSPSLEADEARHCMLRVSCHILHLACFACENNPR